MKKIKKIISFLIVLSLIIGNVSISPIISEAGEVDSIVLGIGDTYTIVGSVTSSADLNTSIATVAESVSTEDTLTKVASLTVGKKYYITNARAEANNPTAVVLTSTEITTSSKTGRLLAGTLTSIPENAVWTLTGTADAYGLSQNGSYLNIGADNAYMTGGEDLKLVYNQDTTYANTWQINDYGESTAYGLNQHGGSTAIIAAGYNVLTDSGNAWNFYEITESGVTSTTITGVAEGITTVSIDGVSYNIIVGDNVKTVDVYIGGTVVVTDSTGDYSSSWDSSKLDTDIATVSVAGSYVQGGTETTYSFTKLTPSQNSSVTGVIKSASGDADTYLTLKNGSIGTTTDVKQATEFTVTYSSSGRDEGYRISADGYYMSLNNGGLSASTQTNMNSLWNYSDSSGFYLRQGGGTAYYLTASGVSNSPANPVGVYKVNESTTTLPDTYVSEISIKGVSAGQTYATVGNTLYVINVEQKEATATLFESETKIYDNVSGSLDTSSIDTSIIDVSLVNGNLSVASKVDVADDAIVTTSFIVVDPIYGKVKYNVTILPEKDTKPVIAVSSSSENGVVEVSAVTINQGMEISLAINGNIELPEVYNAKWYLEGVGYISTSTTEGDSITLTGLDEGVEYLTLVITDKDGAVIYVHEIEVTVIDTGYYEKTGRIVDIYIDEVANTNAYMIIFYDNLNESDETYAINHISSILLLEDELIYMAFDYGNNLGVDFFGGPDEGYVLTKLDATNGSGYYQSLYDTDGTYEAAEYSDFLTTSSTAGVNQANLFNTAAGSNAGTTYIANQIEILRSDVADESTGITYNCQGGMGFTRDNDDTVGVVSSLSFYSERMPSVEVSVVGVLGSSGLEVDYRTYQEGMSVSVGEIVFIKAELNVFGLDGVYSTAPITYSNGLLKSDLNGTYLFEDENSTGNSNYAFSATVTDLLNSSSATTNTYYIVYEITEDDLKSGKITNNISLSYNYVATFKSGTHSVSTTAEFEFTVSEFSAKNIIVDFGLPVTVEIAKWGDKKTELNTEGTATYGTVSVSNGENSYTVTYTPTSVIQGVDEIQLISTTGTIYTFMAIPATTVYYEEYFADELTVNNQNLSQTAEYVGTADAKGKKNVYGYDSVYNEIGPSGNSELIHKNNDDENGPTFATFSFTGTGVDVYTNNGTNTGIVLIWIKNSAGKTVRIIQADTHMEDGDSYFTKGQAVTAYNVPLVSVSGLTHDTYTMELRHVANTTYNEDGTSTKEYRQISIDGFRVHGIIDTSSTIYRYDEEATPTFVELRDAVLAGVGINSDTSEYAEDIAANAWAQVFATGGNASGAVIISSNEGLTNADNNSLDVQDLLDNGPKNELYLKTGDAVVFKVDASLNVQIGLKAVNSEVQYSINGDDEKLISLLSSTDMFYSISGIETDDGKYQTITITNKSGGILSITEIKLINPASIALIESAFYELNEADLVPAMLSLGFESKEPEVISGDLDGDTIVTANDALMVLKYVADLEELDEQQLLAADMDGNEKVSARDALMILKTAAYIE